MLNENFRLLNGISGGWTEFNSFAECFSYRGNVCYSFVRTSGNDSFHGTQFTNCFGQIKKVGGGYGIKATGVSSSALVWIYNSKLDIKFYAGDAACKAISLNFAEMTSNHGAITCEGTVTMEALDDNSRMIHDGSWLNNGTTIYSVVTEMTGTQGRFVFRNAQSRSNITFANASLDSYTPTALNTGPNSYSVNGAFPALFKATGTNFSSPFMACYNYAGNGFYFGQIPYKGSLSDFSPSWKLSNDGGIIKSYAASFRFQISDTETFRVSTTSVYPFTDNAMQLGTSGSRWSAAYFKQFSINDTGLVPTATATYNIGASGAAVNNIYSQNAVTVVSDVRHKTDIRDLTSQEIDCAKLCAKKLKLYKLNAAVDEKGDLARYHVGAIAQDIISAFDDCGLDWSQYGIVTYESWCDTPAIDAVYDENGDIVEDGSPAVTAGDIYMIRYEELNCFIMAAMVQDLGW